MNNDQMGRPESKLTGSDNAENAIKCNECGDTVLIGQKGPEDHVTCPTCHNEMRVGDRPVLGASNEDY